MLDEVMEATDTPDSNSNTEDIIKSDENVEASG